MASRDISGFISWFLGQIYTMFTTLLGYLDNIIIAGGVSLLDFIITILILGLVVSIIIASPGTASHIEKGIEARDRAKAKKGD